MKAITLWSSQADNAQSGSAGVVVTQSDLNPVLQIVTWLLLAITTLMLGFRLLASFFLKAKRVPGQEDVFILISYIFSLGESVTMLLPASRIFGKEIDDISASELRMGLQLGYARDLLFILSLGLAKWSVNAGLRALSPGLHRLPTFVLGAVITLWTTSSFLATAFQCSDRGPWNSDGAQCIDKRGFLEYFSISNILTDTALIIIPAVIVWPLKMSMKTRLTIVCIFGTRALVIAATVCQLVYLPRLFENDYTLRAFPYYVSVQFVQFASISAACVVYFLPLLRSLRSGLVWGDNSTFISNHSLAKISKPVRDGTNERGGSKSRDHSNYIQITTENSVMSKARSQEAEQLPSSNADMYRPNW